VLRQARELKGTLDEDLQAVRAEVDSLQSDVGRFVNTLSSLVERYRSPGAGTGMSSEAFLLRVDGDIGRVIIAVSNLQDRLRHHLEALRAHVDDERIGTSITALISAVEECTAAAAEDRENLESAVKGFVARLRDGRAVDVAALKFGDEVKKLNLGDVPETTQLSLRSTGQRGPGDVIDLKIAFFQAAQEGPGAERILETHRLRMFRVLPHIERTVGVVFVHPIAESSVQHFQPAPGYSLLLKGFIPARGSVLFHSLIDPGIGFNLAAPDLNKDDAPELGVGLVGSLFRDMLQGGFGYDLSEGKSYNFIVIRLPVPGQ
jgi:hypothetical protein